MAEDTAALLRQLTIENADFFGYSMGAGIAPQIAMRRQDLVRKLVLASPAYSRDGIYAEIWEGIETWKLEDLAGSPFQEACAGSIVWEPHPRRDTRPRSSIPETAPPRDAA